MFRIEYMIRHLAICCIAFVGLVAYLQAEPKSSREVRFTSVPDIFNWNISYPQSGWEDTMDWYFERLKMDGPAFTLVAGDIMDARWWDNAEQVRAKTEQYWSGFLKRFADKDMTVYVAPGDHEYGDDGGLAKGDIARAFGHEFSRQMGMPKNGPEDHIGRAYYVREGNLLVVTLDTFEDAGKRFAYTVGEKQLAWLDKVLTEHKDSEFKLVQGHLPIAGPVRSKNSSASMLKQGTKSELWKVLVKHQIDAYLCGEHHRVTVHHCDGIWQIVHGALWGTQTDINYMRGISAPGKLTLELMEFDVVYGGGYIGDHPHRGATNKPRESVRLAASTLKDGPRVTGTLVLGKDGKGSTILETAKGWFSKEKLGK